MTVLAMKPISRKIPENRMRKPFYLYKRSRSKYYSCQIRNSRTGELGPEISTGETNKTKAEAWAREHTEKLHGSTILFGTYAAPFFGPDCPRCTRKELEGSPYSPGTIQTYKYYLNRLIITDEILCLKPIGKITRGDIIQLRERWIKKIGHKISLQKPLDALRTIFAEAEYMELVDYNPVKQVKNVAYTRRIKNILTVEQVRELINPKYFRYVANGRKHTYQNQDDGYRFCVATALYAFAGMRGSEIRALQWKCVDLDKRRIHIVQAFKTKGSGVLGPPKSGYARDTVIPDVLASLLTGLSGPRESDVWVTGLRSRPMGYKKWRDVFSKATEAAGVKTTLHLLRHSLNTALLEKGVNPELIKAVFGWTVKGNEKAEKQFGTNIQENYTHRDVYDLTPLAKAIDEIFTIR